MGVVHGQDLLDFLMQQVGKKYVWAGQDPSVGFDCSGLMWYGAQHFGLSIPRTSNAQLAALRRISIGDAQVGDLVFFDSDHNGNSDHVGMYAGNGQVLVADNPSVPIHVVSVSTEARITGVGRMPGVVNTNISDGGLLHASTSGITGVNGADFSAIIPSARPTYDLFGSLGLQSPNSSLLNENYGLAASFMESDPELANIFSQAVAGTWSTDKFQAALQETNWWSANSDSARKMLAEKYSDPAQYQQDIQNKTQQLTELAAKLGVHLSATGLNSLADLALVTNMSDVQVNGYLSKYLELSQQGHFSGYAGQVELGVREYAREMGVPLTDDYVERAVSGIVAGTDSLQTRRAEIQTIAQQTFPAYADLIKEGVTVGQIAAPYLAAQAKLWEMDPNKIDLFDSTLRDALQSTTVQGQDAVPSQLPLYDFETKLRSNSKWLSTNNARESIANTANQVLSDLGLTSQGLGPAPQTTPQSITDNTRAGYGGLSGSTAFPTLQGASKAPSTQAPSASSLAPDTSFQEK